MKIAEISDIIKRFGRGETVARRYRKVARKAYGTKDVTMAQIIKANNLEA